MRRAFAHAPQYSQLGEVLFLYVAADISMLHEEAREWCSEHIGPIGSQWDTTELGDIVIYKENGGSDHAFAFKLRWC